MTGFEERAGFVVVPLTGRIKVNMEAARAFEAIGNNKQAPLCFITAGVFFFSVPEIELFCR